MRLLFIIIVFISLFQRLEAETRLPQMGEPADQQISPKEERELGLRFLQQAKERLPLIHDYELREYIEKLGERLLAGVNQPNYAQFYFSIINDNSINAFAVPGGVIIINTGLINAFKSESQLAAVISHEIAHITQRHHARAYSDQANAGLTTVAAIVAAILIGQHSPQAGQAALATGLAANTQSQINYTRANEYEADRIGINILSESGFNASAMPESFNILRKYNALNSESLGIEYLRTHPLGDNRIAEAKNRASMKSAYGDSDSLSFHLFKMRMRVINSQDKHSLRKHLSQLPQSTSTLYGLCLIDVINKQQNSSCGKKLLNHQKDNIFLQLLHAQSLYLSGKILESKQQYTEIIDLYPDRFAPVSDFVKVLLKEKNIEYAYSITKQYTNTAKHIEVDAYKLIASIAKKLGNDVSSHEYLGLYYKKIGKIKLAIEQLKLALSKADKGSSASTRLKSTIKQMDKNNH